IAALIQPRLLHTPASLDEAALAKLDEALKPESPSHSSAMAGSPSMDLEKVSEIANAQFSQWQAFFRNMALEAADSVQTRRKPGWVSYQMSATTPSTHASV